MWTKPEKDNKNREVKTSLTMRQTLKKYKIKTKPIIPSRKVWGQTPKDKEKGIHRVGVFFYGMGRGLNFRPCDLKF